MQIFQTAFDYNIPSNFAGRGQEAHNKMFGHNPNLNRWGNAMEFINGTFAGAINPFVSAGEAIGVGDAVEGLGFGIDAATLAAVSALPPDAGAKAVDGLTGLAEGGQRLNRAVTDWSARNPNTAETAEAAFNAAAAAKAAQMAKTAGAGKAAVSGDFGDAYRAEKLSLSNTARELHKDKKYREALDVH